MLRYGCNLSTKDRITSQSIVLAVFAGIINLTATKKQKYLILFF
jgi:hypothetical protein